MSHGFLPLECIFCNYHSEDSSHLFANYPFFSNVCDILIFENIVHSIPRKNDNIKFGDHLHQLHSTLFTFEFKLLLLAGGLSGMRGMIFFLEMKVSLL